MKIANYILSTAIATSLLMTSCSDFNQAPYYEDESYDNYQDNYHNSNFDVNTDRTATQYSNNHQVINNPKNNHSNMNSQQSTQTHNYSNEKLVMKPLMDPQSGMPFGHFPLPESWTIKQDGWYGPEGTKVIFHTMPFQSTQQAPYQSPQQILQGRIGQEIKKVGGKIIGTENLPRIAASDKAQRDLMWTPGTSKSFEAMGLEVITKGEKGYGIIKTEYYQSAYMANWMYTLITLDANPGYYEQAKKTLVYALINFKPNMQRINNWNRNEQQKSNQSWATHNAKMRNNQRNFQAQNQALQNTYNEINEIGMQTYRNQSSSFNRSNQAITNGIYNENTVTNPYDGSAYQTDANYDRTFMNSFGEQIQTNDQFYSPDRDPNAVGYQEVYYNGGGY